MSFLTASLEALLLLAIFSCFSAWTYKYIFNHDIIVNSHRRHTPKADFNRVSASMGYRLLQLETEGGEGNASNSNESDSNPLKFNPSKFNPPNSNPSYSNPSYSNPSYSNPPNSNPSYKPPGLELPTDSGGTVQAVVAIIFSLGVALSLELILVLMIQLFGSVEIGVNIIKLIIKLLVVLASTINPLMVIFLAINSRFSSPKSSPADISRYLVTVPACILWYLALSWFGRIASSLEQDSGSHTLLERKTNEIALLGISITAILSGIGSASTPVRTFWTDGPKLAAAVGRPASYAGVSEAEVNEGIQSYNSTRMILNKRRAELRQMQASSARTRPSKGLFHRVQSLATIGQSDTQDLEREIASLESLNEAIYSELCGKLNRLGHAENKGQYRRFDAVVMLFNVMFSVYCIYRLVNVLVLRLPYHYWKDPYIPAQVNDADADSLNNITKDALAITIAKIIQACFGYLPLSETQLINQVSFFLSGSLFLCSFQNVLVTFTSVGRLLPASEMAETTKSWLKNLILSELLAIYVIATALLIRSNLPSESAESVSHILSLTSESSTFHEVMREVQFIDAWFDKVFAVSGVVSFLILAIKIFIDNDTQNGFDEESMIEDKLS